MRLRRVAAITAAILVAPFLSPAANASPPQHKCEKRVSLEHKCKGGKG